MIASLALELPTGEFIHEDGCYHSWYLTLITAQAYGATDLSKAKECDSAEKYNNRGIGKVTFKRDTQGQPVLQVQTHLSLREPKKTRADLLGRVGIEIELQRQTDKRLPFVEDNDLVEALSAKQAIARFT